MIKLLVDERDWWELAKIAEQKGCRVSTLLQPHLQDIVNVLIGRTLGHEDERLRELWTKGLTDGWIARAMMSTRDSVANRRRKLGLPPNKPHSGPGKPPGRHETVKARQPHMGEK
jgi:hypothetical protein